MTLLKFKKVLTMMELVMLVSVNVSNMTSKTICEDFAPKYTIKCLISDVRVSNIDFLSICYIKGFTISSIMLSC